MTKKKTTKKTTQKKSFNRPTKTIRQSKNNMSDKKTFAFLATFLSIIGFIIAIMTKNKDDYVMFYAKQSLVIFIIGLIVSLVNVPLRVIPLMGPIIIFALNLLVIIAWVMSWVFALSGEKKDIPVIEIWTKKFDL